MLKTMTSERATVLTSAVVAIAILGAAVTAQPSRPSSTERLARLESDLRYQLELDARVDRSQFAARTETLDGVMEAWQKSPKSETEYRLLVGWLQQALRSSLPGESDEWPPAPQFRAQTVDKPAEHEVRNEIAKAKPSEKLQSKPKATVSSVKDAELTGAEAVHDKKPTAAPLLPTKPQASKADTTAASEKPFIVHISDPVPTGAQTVVNDSPPAPQAAAAPQEAAQPDEVDVAERPAPTAAQTAEVYRHDPVEAEGDIAKPPATADLRQAAEAPVEVNLAELNTRIGGYHDGLREVEAALVAGRKEMAFGELAKLVSRLEELAGQCEFVHLYYGALTREERHFVIAPRSIAATVELADQQRKRMEAAGVEDHFSAADEPGDSELARRLQALLESAPERGRSKACCGGRP